MATFNLIHLPRYFLVLVVSSRGLFQSLFTFWAKILLRRRCALPVQAGGLKRPVPHFSDMDLDCGFASAARSIPYQIPYQPFT